MIVMEHKNHQNVVLPPYTTCKICRNNMTECCVEDCAINKNFKFFEPKKEMNPMHLPRFTMKEYDELPGKIKGELLAFYIIKILEVLNGRDIDDTSSR